VASRGAAKAATSDGAGGLLLEAGAQRRAAETRVQPEPGEHADEQQQARRVRMQHAAAGAPRPRPRSRSARGRRRARAEQAEKGHEQRRAADAEQGVVGVHEGSRRRRRVGRRQRRHRRRRRRVKDLRALPDVERARQPEDLRGQQSETFNLGALWLEGHIGGIGGIRPLLPSPQSRLKPSDAD